MTKSTANVPENAISKELLTSLYHSSSPCESTWASELSTASFYECKGKWGDKSKMSEEIRENWHCKGERNVSRHQQVIIHTRCFWWLKWQYYNYTREKNLNKICVIEGKMVFYLAIFSDTWPASWETYIQVRKQQLELDMEQQTGSKQEKEYVKAVYCHPA